MREIEQRSGIDLSQNSPLELSRYMKLISDARPGTYQPQFFQSDEEYQNAVLEHVDMMNAFVIEWAARDVRVGAGLQNYHEKILVGNFPIPEHPTMDPNARNPVHIQLRNATQWDNYSTC